MKASSPVFSCLKTALYGVAFTAVLPAFAADGEIAGSDAAPTLQEQQQQEVQQTEQQQTQLKQGKGKGEGQGGAQRSKNKGDGEPSKEGKSGPYGSKNKPQKGGK